MLTLKTGSLFLALCAATAWGIEVVKLTTEEIQGKKIQFEETNTGKYPLSVTSPEGTLAVLDPRFHPPIATDGKNFFELNGSFTSVTRLSIAPDGKLESRRVSDDQLVEPDESARPQLAAYLIGLSREARAAFSAGTEAFLVETEKKVGDKLVSGGYDAGSTLIAASKKYRVLGTHRYPQLLVQDDRTYFKAEAGAQLSQLLFSGENGELTTGQVPGLGAPAPLTPKTKWAYFNLVSDSWNDYSPVNQKKLRPFLDAYLKERGPGIAVRTENIVYPSSFESISFVDEKGIALSQAEVKERTLNFVLNFIGHNKEAKPAKEVKSKDGPRFDLAAFLPPEKMARLQARNPYACAYDDKIEFRLDWLISTTLSDTFYRELMDIPPTLAELDKNLGIETAFKPGNAARANVAAPISGVAHVGRVASSQPQAKHPGRTFFGTYDFAVDEKGNLKNPKGDFKKHPADFEYTGGEFIWEKDNAYPAYALFVSNGKSLAAAPDSLVNDTESRLGPFIKNPASCLHCHANMTRSPTEGTMQDAADWSLTEVEFAADPEMKKRFPSYQAYQAVVKKHYGKAKKFVDKTEASTVKFVEALLKSKAFVGNRDNPGEPTAVLPEFFRHYNDNLTFARAAKELGATHEEFKKLIPPSGRLDNFPERGTDVVNVGAEHIRRDQFENFYCTLKARLKKLREETDEKTGPTRPDH